MISSVLRNEDDLIISTGSSNTLIAKPLKQTICSSNLSYELVLEQIIGNDMELENCSSM